ncbi:MAG TPA: alpha/beta hydrolase [Polyangiaceae bacterium]
MTAGPVSIEAWKSRGNTLAVPEGNLFWVDTAPHGTERTAVCILHGFPTSSHDFSRFVDLVAPSRRVVTLDFIGFGLSDKPLEHGYSIFEHADAVCAVVKAAGLSKVHLFAHDLGTSVATELCARKERGLLPFELASLTLMNGSVHVEMADLTFGQIALRTPLASLFARLNNQRSFKLQMKRIFGKPVSEADLDAMWALLERADGTQRLPQTIRYIDERTRFRRRWVGALERFDRPAHVAWGRLDPVAVMPIARKLAEEIPYSQLSIWDDLGHYPQVEAPDVVATTVTKFWDQVDSGA